MKTIWKYQLRVPGEQQIYIPSVHRFLSVQMQGDTPTLWALVDHDSPRAERTIAAYGTGRLVSDEEYIGTVQEAGGTLIWHVFAR